MREQVLDIVHSAGGRLRAVRAAESAAVAAVAAALGCAAVAVSWVMPPRHAWAGVGVAIFPLGAAITLASWPAVRRHLRLDARASALAAGIFLASAAAAVWGALAGRAGTPSPVPPAWAVAAAALPLAAVLAAALAWVFGPTDRQAAIAVDLRCGLGERLSTAFELASSGQADTPMARCVYAQAVVMAERRNVRGARLWRRSRATAGALGLSLLLCLATLMLPARRSPAALENASVAGRLADSLGALSSEQRRELAEALRRAAAQAAEPAAEQLRSAAVAAEGNDPAALERLLDALARGELRLARIIPPDVLGAIGGESGEGTGAAGGATPTPGPVASVTPTPAVSPTPPAAGLNGGAAPTTATAQEWVAVVSPNLRPLPTGPAGPEEAQSPPAPVAWRTAWDAARAAAADALRRQTFPPDRRQLVRDFFAEDASGAEGNRERP